MTDPPEETTQIRSGRRRRYTVPLGSRAPALERCLVRHRALQMILIIYHAEELKRQVISAADAQKRLRGEARDAEPVDAGDPGKQGKRQKRAFDFLVQDDVLTREERHHMVGLIGRRNGIAHHLDQVTADLTIGRSLRDWVDYMPNRQAYDYEALDQLRAARDLLTERMTAKHYVLKLSLNDLFFETTEKVLTADLKVLERRIHQLVRVRQEEIGRLNGELSLVGTALTGLFDPAWPENRYARGRLTPRGVETCYQLFDMGKSTMAVAHLMDLSLASARRRERMWRALGGPDRQKRELADIPRVRVRYPLDD